MIKNNISRHPTFAKARNIFRDFPGNSDWSSRKELGCLGTADVTPLTAATWSALRVVLFTDQQVAVNVDLTTGGQD